MIVQFSINPMDSEHISEDVAKVTDYLKAEGVDYCVGPIGTTIQGDWTTVMAVIETCHRMISGRHARVLTNIAIDDHPGKERSLLGAIEAGIDGKRESIIQASSREVCTS